MKTLGIFILVVTLISIVLFYLKNKDMKKFMIALLLVGLIVVFSIMGSITRQILPLFIAHYILVLVSWGGWIGYMLKGRYYWWAIFSPTVTILLFLLLEFITGSRNEAI